MGIAYAGGSRTRRGGGIGGGHTADSTAQLQAQQQHAQRKQNKATFLLETEQGWTGLDRIGQDKRAREWWRGSGEGETPVPPIMW